MCIAPGMDSIWNVSWWWAFKTRHCSFFFIPSSLLQLFFYSILTTNKRTFLPWNLSLFDENVIKEQLKEMLFLNFFFPLHSIQHWEKKISKTEKTTVWVCKTFYKIWFARNIIEWICLNPKFLIKQIFALTMYEGRLVYYSLWITT